MLRLSLLLLTTSVMGQAYNVSPIAFNIEPKTGTLITMVDDVVSGVIPIGFQFCYWGNKYTQCYIGSNGFVSFSAGQPIAFTPFPIPLANAITPRNCIMSPFHDLHPGVAGFPITPMTYVYYYTTGIAPNRRMVVSWNNCPMYTCTAIRSTQQIVIYETTNVIHTNIEKKSTCVAWVNGYATHGLHNVNATQAIIVLGRNATQWAIAPAGESWEFIPTECCYIFDSECEIN